MIRALILDAEPDAVAAPTGEPPDDLAAMPPLAPPWLRRQVLAHARERGCRCDPEPALRLVVLADPDDDRDWWSPLLLHAAGCVTLHPDAIASVTVTTLPGPEATDGP